MNVILITNEAADFWKTKKVKGFIIILDIEKTFDKINWQFIDFMLSEKGFPQKWRNWIKSYVSSVQYSVIINGRS